MATGQLVSTQWLAVGGGAAVGAWIRWGLGIALNASVLPMGTLIANLGGGLWSVPVSSIGTLNVISPTNYGGNYNVVVSNGLESETIAVTVTPVADTPILSTVDVEDHEDTVGVSLAAGA